MAAVNVLGDNVTTPRMPPELVVARVAYVVAGVLLLAGSALDYLIRNPYSVARAYPAWLGLVVPFVFIVFAVLIRGGGNGVRVTLTVLSALFGLGSVGVVMDRRPGEDSGSVVAAVLMLALFAVAVVLHYLPRSNAYVREVRRR